MHVEQIKDIYEEPLRFTVVVERFESKSLFNYIGSLPTKNLTEGLAAGILQQILLGLRELNSAGLLHGDVKFANVALRGGKSPGEIELKLTNVGIASSFAAADKRNKDMYGTPCFTAPELFSPAGKPTPKADLWSCGILCYVLLAGSYPYTVSDVDSLEGIRYQASRKDFAASIPTEPGLQHVSAEGKDFLVRTLCKDPTKRPSVDELLKHPWFEKASKLSTDEECSRKVFSTLLGHYVRIYWCKIGE